MLNKFELVSKLLKLTNFSEELLMSYSSEELEETYNNLKDGTDEPNSTDSVNLNTLKGIIGEECYWIGQTITLDEARNGIDKVKEIRTMFKDFSEQTREWHLGRIKHFVNNPNLIDPITIDDNCCGNVQIIDGNHRYLAKLILNHDTIDCSYSGLVSTLDYLKIP